MSKQLIVRASASIMLVVCAYPSLSLAQTGTWTPKADLAAAKYGLATSVVDGKIYAIGGRAGGQSFSTVEAYDPATDTWTRKADMPTARNVLSTSVVNGKIFAIGGGVGGSGPTALVEEYDPATNTWRRRADMPNERFGLSTSVVDGKIYAIGGTVRGGVSGSSIVEEYDPATDTWRRRTDMPSERTAATSVVDGKIYAIGGFSLGPGACSTVEQYDPATDTWTQKADMPTARANLCTSVLDGIIYAIGGVVYGDTDLYLTTVEAYDPATDTWKSMADDMPTARHNLSTSVVNGSIYALGGQSGPWPAVTAAVEAYTPLERPFSETLPAPANGARDVFHGSVLQWTPDEPATSYDVYLGTVWEDVDRADVSNPLGVLVSQEQDVTAFNPGPLAFDQPYYWRVDEWTGDPENALSKGRVWGFTTEPYAYPIETVTVTASSAAEEHTGPEKTIDGSGLDAQNRHGNVLTDMWLSRASDPEPWIQYAFDRPYKLHEMWVWNANQRVESVIGFGVKEVAIEVSLNGVDWTPLPGVTQFAQAPGASEYAHNTVVDLTGTYAKHIRLNIHSAWGTQSQYGLSEVRFLYVPTWARLPLPAHDAAIEGLDAVLTWRPGREVDYHEVSFSTDSAAVASGSAVISQTTDTFLDLSELEFGRTYFWSITEVNAAEDPSTYAGDIWSFNTPAYFMLDDFDLYDNDCDTIFFTWLDGVGHTGVEDCAVAAFAGNGSGSVVGNLQAPYAEQGVVRSGQSLSLVYDNSVSPFYSEVESSAFALPSDWIQGGSDALSVYFRGFPQGFQDHGDGRITMNGMGANIWGNVDEFRFAYKELTGDGEITVRLDSVQHVHDWTLAGVMMRNSLSPGDFYVQVMGTPLNATNWQYRDVLEAATGGFATGRGQTPLPLWIRLIRSGSNFTGQRSSDGVNWETIAANKGPSTINLRRMRNSIYVGLVVSSHERGQTALAEFSHVSVTGNVSPDWQLADVGVEQIANEPESIYLAVEDQAGQFKLVEHPDPAATQIGEWTQWTVPFSVFESLDLNNVQKLYFGVGDRNNPSPGSQGTVFFDDIQVGRMRSGPGPLGD